MKTVALLLLLVGLLAPGQGWKNNYDDALNFVCPASQSISSIASEHNNDREDRVWDFSCQDTYGQSGCYWTDYVNDFDQLVLFECSAQHVIAGMSSYHSNTHEDRRWKFYCCKSSSVSASCHWTKYVNNFDEYFHWSVPSGNVLVGVHSYHQNEQEDRRWAYKSCVLYNR
ncbi:hemagglutinin/amebocyte aggregation factor-like [Garra rufa]|uniref:hemagglutinin/amebocyte aggregation factor-like n=1 Tax=Garra rufa TaxID=137080 RepID=UPI003CCEBA4B